MSDADSASGDGGGGAAKARIPKEVRAILQRLASEWADVADSQAFETVRIKGALTNEVYQINWPSDAATPERSVLLRIYGEGVDVFFDREDENRTLECMSRHGQGPRLLGRFSNGRVEEFIHARTLSAADLRDPEISALIALKLKEFHDLDMPGTKRVYLWDRLRNWHKIALNLCSSDEAKEFHLAAIEEEIKALENFFTVEDLKIGFCHNDLQYGNIMLDEETRRVTIISLLNQYRKWNSPIGNDIFPDDKEAIESFNPIAYDIANHFCEMAADYHSEKPHIMDFTKYPDLEQCKRFVEKYLDSSGENSDDVEAVEKLLESIDKYTLVSHLTWGLWGIIWKHVNDIYFDYMEYARQRFQQYWLRKPAILGSGSPQKS